MRTRRFMIASLALVLFGALAFWQAPNLAERLAYAQEAGRADAAREGIKQARNLSDAFKHVARTAKPSVVNITSVRKMTRRRRAPQLPPGFRMPPGFEDFFGRQPRGGGEPREFERRGTGTGVIVDDDGTILTNNHVVAGADDITVRLVTGKEYKAELVGTDPKTDVAVLKIEPAEDLVAAPLGDSEALEVGEWVLAVGSPFGLEQTVTAGIVSAKGRANMGIAEYEDFIQTDAAINPGNSGGPLMSLEGKVIGINTAIASRTGGNQGIGFAIPINMARSIMESLIDKGRVTRGWLGVLIQNLDEQMAEGFGFEGTEGVLIGDVMEGSPAERGGLQPGDIVLKFDGEEVADVNELRNRVAATEPGSKVPVVIFRDGERETLQVPIEQMEEGATVAAERTEEAENLGMTVGNIDEETADKLGLKNTRGVLVLEVERGSPAARAGVRPNDVILAVNRRRVQTMADYRKAMQQAEAGRGVLLRVKSDDLTRYVFVRPE